MSMAPRVGPTRAAMGLEFCCMKTSAAAAESQDFMGTRHRVFWAASNSLLLPHRHVRTYQVGAFGLGWFAAREAGPEGRLKLRPAVFDRDQLEAVTNVMAVGDRERLAHLDGRFFDPLPVLPEVQASRQGLILDH